MKKLATKKLQLTFPTQKIAIWEMMAEKTANTLNQLICIALLEYQQNHFPKIQKIDIDEILPRKKENTNFNIYDFEVCKYKCKDVDVYGHISDINYEKQTAKLMFDSFSITKDLPFENFVKLDPNSKESTRNSLDEGFNFSGYPELGFCNTRPKQKK